MTALLATKSLREQSHVDLKLMSAVRCLQSRAKHTLFAVRAKTPMPTIAGTTGMMPAWSFRAASTNTPMPKASMTSPLMSADPARHLLLFVRTYRLTP